jgi:hypothetical protein
VEQGAELMEISFFIPLFNAHIPPQPQSHDSPQQQTPACFFFSVLKLTTCTVKFKNKTKTKNTEKICITIFFKCGASFLPKKFKKKGFQKLKPLRNKFTSSP